jgi:hypothetical protein
MDPKQKRRKPNPRRRINQVPHPQVPHRTPQRPRRDSSRGGVWGTARGSPLVKTKQR